MGVKKALNPEDAPLANSRKSCAKTGIGIGIAAGLVALASGSSSPDHAEAFNAMLAALMDKSSGVLADASAISVVGHRVVHGGEKFTGAVVIDDAILGEVNQVLACHLPIIIKPGLQLRI